MKKLIIAWDLGTSGNKTSLYSEDGLCLAEETVSYKTHYTPEGWHEHCPADWWVSVVQGTRRILEKTGVDKNDIYCCGISGHSMCCIPMDENRQLLVDRVPIWSDARATEEAAAFFEKFDQNEWYRITGAGTKPESYPVFELVWYRNHYPDIYNRIHTVLGTTDYINFRLTGVIATGRSNACGTGCYDLQSGEFHEEILRLNGLRRDMFPRIVEETDVLGTILPEVAEELGLSPKTLVTVGGTDNISMATGARCFQDGRAYIALGTSCWISWTGMQPVLDVNSYPYIFPFHGMFCSGLSLASGGSAYKWAKEQFCQDLTGPDAYARMDELICQSPPGANGLLFNSCLGGGMPFDPGPNMRGGYLGLQLKHTRADILRATLEGITFKLRECKEALEKVAHIDDEILLVGGGSKTDVWRQIIADCMGKTVIKSSIDDQASALGAAAFAAVGTGIWSDYSVIDRLHTIENRTKPIAENTALYNALFPIYKEGSVYLAELGDAMKALKL